MTASLPNVLWIGGPPSSGKTTIGTRLARRHSLRLYSADTRTWLHRDRALGIGNANARRFEAVRPIDYWKRATPEELFAMSLHSERGQMVVDDLRTLPAAPLVVAEGSVLPAWAVSSGIAASGQAVWLIPSAGFQEQSLAAREVTDGAAGLYRLQRAIIEREALDHRVPVLVVDGSLDIAAMTAAVEQHFSAALASGPHAQSSAERQALLREINDAIIGQVRGFYGRPWANGDPEAVKRVFVCECGQQGCYEEAFITVGEAAKHPMLTPAHQS